MNPLPVEGLPKKPLNAAVSSQLLLSNLSSAVSLTGISPVSNISACKP